MDIRLIAFDLDGTLLDDDKNISGENLRAMERAAEKGIMLVPATGRIYRGLPELLRSLPFLRRYILVNGAYVYDAGEDRCLVREDIDCARALEFLAYADTLGVLYDCYQDNWGYMTERMLEEALRVVPSAAARDLIRTLRSPVPELKRYLRQQGTGVQKLQLYFTDPEQRLRELEKLPDLFPDLSISTSVFCNIEINARGATKGRALLSLRGAGAGSLADHGPGRRNERPGNAAEGRPRRRHGKRRTRRQGRGRRSDREQQRERLCRRRGEIRALKNRTGTIPPPR